ncbi:MAG: indole-3-glycerol phosphate synthase TrpC [Nitrospina sp.]|jgi:indole-3-glycerol phosphate synthase|nr:indole-3-glycerol phosphate synthase TrpC [Nitrospina sp.]MBT6600533.1 indole-3-glycerol phosphate synthase TrpC [Nitrospina sp.]
MPDILDKIFCEKKVELDTVKCKLPLPDVKILIANNNYKIRDAKTFLKQNELSSIIAEIKPRTPFKGTLLKKNDPVDIAKTYADNGASALSILTESRYFGGSLLTLEKAREYVDIPLLRKDFIFDEYQVYEARAFGADFFLLIATWLDKNQLADLLALGRELGLSALIETHNENDMEKAFEVGASIIGINNRDLTSGKTDLSIARRLIPMALQIPDNLLVCESGIRSRSDIEEFQNLGAHSFLIGESLMTAENIGNKLREFTGDRKISTTN